MTGVRYQLGLRGYAKDVGSMVGAYAIEPAFSDGLAALDATVTDAQKRRGDSYTLMQKIGDDWYFVQMENDKNIVKKFSSTASPADRVVNIVNTVGYNIINGIIVVESGERILYYCRETSPQVIVRNNLETSAETVFDMIVPGLQCSGRNMEYYEDDGERYLLFVGYFNEMNQIISLKLD